MKENKPVKNQDSNNRASNKRGNSIAQMLTNDFPMCATEEGNSELLPDTKTYTVKEVVGHRIDEKGDLEYLIKWEGYCSEDDSWEPRRNFVSFIFNGDK